MRTIINRNTSTDIRGNCQGRIVVTGGRVVRAVKLVLPVFGRFLQAGRFAQAVAGYLAALTRALDTAATEAAHAAESAIDSLDSSMRRLSRCWHTPRCFKQPVMPHLAVVKVGS